MYTIEYIRSGTGGRVTLGLSSDGERLSLSVRTSSLDSLSAPYKGGSVTHGELIALQAEDEEYRATKKALSMLGYSDKNCRTLRTRLRQSGFSDEAAGSAIAYCLDHGYIDEQRQIERLVLSEANVSLRGPRYITEKLAAKGYSRRDIESTVESLTESGDIDFKDNFRRLCEKKGALDAESRRALAYKYGYKSTEQ